MEREKFSRSEFSIKKALGKVVLSSAVAFSASHALPIRENDRSDDAQPVIARYDSSLFQTIEPEIVYEAPKLTKKQIKKIEEQENLENVVSAMESDKMFKKRHVKDVKIYYPIYKAVADKYDLDWYLLFIVHEHETGASAGTRVNPYYVGGMQRDPNVWTEEYVDKAFDGLEHLARLPQRRKGDAREIAAAGRILNANYDKYKGQGDSKNEAVLKALLLYSAERPAYERFDDYKDYKKVLDQVPEYKYKPVLVVKKYQ